VEKIVFADCWQPTFAEFGLRSFDDFFYYSKGRRINKKNKRDVLTFTLEGESLKKQFFMKRFVNPHFKDMLFTLHNLGRLCSQAAYEWENANILLGNRVGAYRPLCYGEQTSCGLERKSFFITEKLSAELLTDFVGRRWQELRAEQKEQIIVELGKFVRRIHDLNLSLPDLYLWHIFIKENQNRKGWEFAVIDLHRMMCNVTDQNRRIRNLGALDHSMLDKYFDNPVRQLFIESYAGPDWPDDIAKLSSKVKKYSAAVSAKRNPKPY